MSFSMFTHLCLNSKDVQTILSLSYLVWFSFQLTSLLLCRSLDCLVNLADVDNGSHGTVVRYFTTAYTLRVIKPMACQQPVNQYNGLIHLFILVPSSCANKVHAANCVLLLPFIHQEVLSGPYQQAMMPRDWKVAIGLELH